MKDSRLVGLCTRVLHSQRFVRTRLESIRPRQSCPFARPDHCHRPHASLNTQLSNGQTARDHRRPERHDSTCTRSSFPKQTRVRAVLCARLLYQEHRRGSWPSFLDARKHGIVFKKLIFFRSFPYFIIFPSFFFEFCKF